MNTPQTPDYGEPWTLTTDFAFDITVKGSLQGSFNTMELANRAIACVGACVGMADPVEEIEAMRTAIHSAWELLQGTEDHLVGNHSMFVQDAITKLQPFLKP